MKLDVAPDELRSYFCEPCVPGFEHVVEAADDTVAVIIRHLRTERHDNQPERWRTDYAHGVRSIR